MKKITRKFYIAGNWVKGTVVKRIGQFIIWKLDNGKFFNDFYPNDTFDTLEEIESFLENEG